MATPANPDDHRLATRVVHGGRPATEPDSPVNPPVVFSATYTAGGPTGYGRFGNPTWAAFEEVLGDLEGGRALAFGSGLAAAGAVLERVRLGGVVVAPRHCYNGVLARIDDLVATGRIGELRRVDIADTDAVAQACAGADLIWCESPTNPAMEVADLAALCAAARVAGALSCVDNTFATPLLQNPLRMGADVVLHSATKFLAGHSDVLLGAVVTADATIHDALLRHRSLGGAVPGPMEAWLALRGIRTLALRVQRAGENAAVLAERLVAHPAIGRVRYPGLAGDPGHRRAAAQMRGFGAVISIELAAGALAAQALCETTRLWVHATSLGGVESLLERRRRWAAEPETIPPELVRLSVGIEDVEDLWNDLAQALDRLEVS